MPYALSIQEIEELQFSPRSESENCLTEAEQYARELSADVETTGEGPIIVEISHPYFCRSTDAFAGNYIVSRHRCADHDAADAFLAEYHAGPDFDYDSSAEVIPPRPRRSYAAPVAVADGEDDGIPF